MATFFDRSFCDHITVIVLPKCRWCFCSRLLKGIVQWSITRAFQQSPWYPNTKAIAKTMWPPNRSLRGHIRRGQKLAILGFLANAVISASKFRIQKNTFQYCAEKDDAYELFAPIWRLSWQTDFSVEALARVAESAAQEARRDVISFKRFNLRAAS